ncbi:hypothetical protein ACFFUB_00300 [Algimonas porphyrae]|uniref:Uncharacterized protein n=1 Tax=Algimonas porphyrae TaxID=1128113 RepID=A0ABQ5V0C6_9PROT|nr:hypothetical protein [Algimonas porphyrae]GLQ20470.1 hypothetical protein GCM10007854_14250 [Algimonas porphyrae]
MSGRGVKRCDAKFCQDRIGRGQLMCRTHWAMVSRTTQTQVNAAWRRYKKREIDIYELVRVQSLAIDEVAKAEGVE